MIQLSTEQQAAVDTAILLSQQGGTMFLTGRPGTGKTATSKVIRKTIKNTVVLAPTGLAAITAGGQTIHSACGLRPGPIERRDVNLTSKQRAMFANASLIIVDEVSMVRSDVMECLDEALRQATGVNESFGGKGVLFVGDVWQIEPIVVGDHEKAFLESKFGGPFFFDAPCWREAMVPMLELTIVFRQAGDQTFIDALNVVRTGGFAGLQTFNQCVRQSPDNAIRLTFTNRKAAAINAEAMLRVTGMEETYESTMSGSFGKDTPADISLTLKVGARVMTISNNRLSGYINGDMGEVTDLEDNAVIVRLDRNGVEVRVERFVWEKREHVWNAEEKKIESRVVAEFTQIPVRLAYAVTVHKSQGQTYEKCHLELEINAFAHGQTYVALSRCKTLDGLSLGRRLSGRDLVINQRVAQWWDWMTNIPVD